MTGEAPAPRGKRVWRWVAGVVTVALLVSWGVLRSAVVDAMQRRAALVYDLDVVRPLAERSTALAEELRHGRSVLEKLHYVAVARTLWSQKLDHVANVVHEHGDGRTWLGAIVADTSPAGRGELTLSGFCMGSDARPVEGVASALEGTAGFSRGLVSIDLAPPKPLTLDEDGTGATAWAFEICCVFERPDRWEKR